MDELEFAFYSDVGGRTNNEDSCLAKKTDGGYIFIAADGLGGEDHGEKASAVAVDAVREFLLRSNSISDAIQHANAAVLKAQKEFGSKMKTTIAAVLVTDEKTFIAHAGDTRVCALKNGRIIFQTADHSAAQLAVLAGEIESSQLRSHPDRNMLTKALGAAESVKPDVAELDNSAYDALLLCTDGFWEYVYENEISQTALSWNSANKWLYGMKMIHKKRAPENCDNNTAVAVMRGG